MAQLLKTDTVGKDKHKHYHMVFLINNESGITAVSDDHTHEVLFNINTTPPQWEIGPGGDDGHTHAVIDLELVEPEIGGTDKEEVETVHLLRKEAKSADGDSYKDALESEEFYNGSGQWDKDVKIKLEGQKRAALTINEIEAKIDILLGHQKQNRTDIKFLPVEGGDTAVADILNILTKNVLEQNDYLFEESDIFEDECVAGRGIFNTFIDRDNNIEGDIIVEHFPWKDVYFGPHNRRNASDCEYLCKERWYSKAHVKQLWPKKATEINEAFNTIDLQKELTETAEFTGDKYEPPNAIPLILSENGNASEHVDIARKTLKVIECLKKEYIQVSVIVGEPFNFVFDGEGLPEKDIKQIETIPGLIIRKRNTQRIRSTIITNRILLDNSHLEDINELPMFPVYAKKRGNKWWGKVENAKDLQREINKRHSQSVDVVNKAAAYGFYYDDDTFVDNKDAEAFKNGAMSPGFVTKVKNADKPPTKEEGIKFPSELANMMNISRAAMDRIMNINPELQGLKSNVTSGVAIMQRKQSGLMGNEYLFDSLSMGKRRLGKLLVKYYQNIYTTERIVRIIENKAVSAANNDVTVGGLPVVANGEPTFRVPTPGPEAQSTQPVIPGQQGQQQVPPQQQEQPPEERIAYSIEDIETLLNENDLTKYDVVVSESQYNPTTQLANFTMLGELAKQGMPIPPIEIIKVSPLPENTKTSIIKGLAASQAQAAQADQQKNQTEIDKTLIANQDKGQPPGPPQ